MAMEIYLTGMVTEEINLAHFRGFDAFDTWVNRHVLEHQPSSYIELEKEHFEELYEVLQKLDSENYMKVFPTVCKGDAEMIHYWDCVNDLKALVSKLLVEYDSLNYRIFYSMSC